MSGEPLRVAIVGLGRWANTVAAEVQRTPRMRLITCYTRTPAKREAFSRKFGCGQEVSYEALLEHPEVEAVIITAPNPMHAELAVAAAACGKHVRVDKPITTTIADARAMIRTCAEAGVVLAVASPYRHLRGLRIFRETIQGGTMGVMAMAEANNSSDRGLRWCPNLSGKQRRYPPPTH